MCFYRGIVVKDSFPCLKKKKQEMMIKDFFIFFGDDLGQWTK